MRMLQQNNNLTLSFYYLFTCYVCRCNNFTLSFHYSFTSIYFSYLVFNRRDGVVVRAFASQSVDLGFNPLVESYQKLLKNGIHSFPARPESRLLYPWARHVTGPPTFMWKTGGPVFPLNRWLVAGKASDRKNKNAML